MLVRFFSGFRIFVISSDNLVFITSNQYPLFFKYFLFPHITFLEGKNVSDIWIILVLIHFQVWFSYFHRLILHLNISCHTRTRENFMVSPQKIWFLKLVGLERVCFFVHHHNLGSGWPAYSHRLIGGEGWLYTVSKRVWLSGERQERIDVSLRVYLGFRLRFSNFWLQLS